MQGHALRVAIVTSLLSAGPLMAQAPASRIRTPSVLPISSITVTGNKITNTEAVLASSGLKVNDNGGPAMFDAARDRLLDTGYFDSVSYSFRQQDLGFAVTFTVIEMKQAFPIRVEALPITPDEVVQLLKSKDPLFNGLLPAAKQVLDRAAATVEQSLSATNPGLRVRAKVIPAGPDRFEVQFAPAEGLPVIADVTFEGSAIVKDNVMHEVMIEHGIGQVFSEASLRALLDRYIRPLFEKEGYMRVSFPQVTNKPSAGVKGIEVHVTVADGERYKLGTVSVLGKMQSDSKRILRMANLPQSDFVNGNDLQQGADRIHDTLRGEGYLDVSVTTGHAIDEPRKAVNVWFEVNPGELYTFGKLEVLGLGLDGEAAIRKSWGVKTGDPFPGGYPDHFVETIKAEGLFDNLGAITATPSINRQTHVVDVSLHFASAPAPTRPRRTQ